MNLFWMKILGRFKSTNSYEKQETALFTAGSKLQTRRGLTNTFHDDFDRHQLENWCWNSGFYFRNEKLLRHYSFTNEKQANNSGKNTTLSNSNLQIYTRQETAKTQAWHPQKGFAPKQFLFTSDIIQSAAGFRQQGGVFKAKLRCSGPIHHAFWLGTEQEEPHINIFHYNGSEIEVGYVSHGTTYSRTIKGIQPDQYYIYTLEWTPKELIWSINNLVVFRANQSIPRIPLHLVFNSFIPNHLPGNTGLLEVDWVRVYAHKS